MIALMFGRDPVYTRFRHTPVAEFALSAIVQFELFFGAVNGDRREKSLTALEKLRFPVLPFDEEDALRAAEIRAALKSIGTPIGPYDVLIAGQALARDLTLVTRNIREFARVDGLRVENWEA
jgi:tRNA(fMet)-specific endonuclease VapC